jgi:hypothetical protein
MKDGNGWASRKLWATIPLVGAGLMLTAYLLTVGRYGLAVVVFGIAAAVVAVYSGVNAWQARSYSNHGHPPGLEP